MAQQEMTEALAEALTRGEITIAFQPKVVLETGRLIGMEALARWTSPSLGVVPPERFIPIAERQGLIGALTDRVLREAVATCAHLRRFRPDLTMAVNISPVLLSESGLADRIADTLAAAGLPAEALVVEITESSVIHDPARAGVTLGVLRARGVACAIDDFGTGHASLLTLLRLPFSEIKIDRAFVEACVRDPEAEMIIRATLGLAREMRLGVVAEGIETAGAEQVLLGLGCIVGQGFRYGRPIGPSALLDRLMGETRALQPG